MAIPNLLAASLANFIRDGVQAARERRDAGRDHSNDVEVRFENIVGYATILVKDNGLGLTQEALEDLLQKMKLFESSHPHNDKGGGYALTTAHNIICTEHKGIIDASSVLGSGVTWRISIPTIEEEYDNDVRSPRSRSR
jgi:signal transduction histidine kinase